MLSVIEEHGEKYILGLCESNEDVSCTGTCELLVDELKSGEFNKFESDIVEEVCQHNNWCHTEESQEFLSSLPSQTAYLINHINSVQSSWKADLYPRWNKTSRQDFKRFLGTIVDEDHRCEVRDVDDNDYGIENLPDNFDSEENWPNCGKLIGDIRDQSNCGCCWAFAGAEAASDRMCIATNGTMDFPLSAQTTCFCASYNGCGGGQVTTPWSFIKRSGVPSGGQVKGTGPFGTGMCSDFTLPHCHHHGPQGNDPYPAEGQPGCPSESSPMCPRRCLSTATAPHDNFKNDEVKFDGRVSSYRTETAIMNAIMNNGPLECAFTVYEDFANYVSGIYRHVSGSYEGGHAVKMVGWGVENGEKYWKIANSWNPYWGEKGYFRIRRGDDECGIESQVVGSSADATWSQGFETLE